MQPKYSYPSIPLGAKCKVDMHSLEMSLKYRKIAKYDHSNWKRPLYFPTVVCSSTCRRWSTTGDNVGGASVLRLTQASDPVLAYFAGTGPIPA